MNQDGGTRHLMGSASEKAASKVLGPIDAEFDPHALARKEVSFLILEAIGNGVSPQTKPVMKSNIRDYLASDNCYVYIAEQPPFVGVFPKGLAVNAREKEEILSLGRLIHKLAGVSGMASDDYLCFPNPSLSACNQTAADFLGMLYAELGQLEAAIAAWHQALTQDPERETTRFNYAIALHKAGHYPEAIAQYERLLALRPDSDQAAPWLLNLGAARRKMRDLAGAIACYRQVLSRDPNSLDARRNLGNALEAAGAVSAPAAAGRPSSWMLQEP